MKTLVSTFEGSEANDVPAQIKNKLKELAEEGMKWAIKTAQNLNHLSQWTIMTPPDIQGNCSCFSLYQEDGAVVLTCQPWHQFVDERDIWRNKIEMLVIALHTAGKFGVQTSHSKEDISMIQEMMTPKSQLTLDGQTVYFFKLWEKHLESLESGELQEENEKLRNVLQKELKTTEYFYAATPPGTPPLATSLKKPMY